jgi:phenylacetate-CoA ligase
MKGFLPFPYTNGLEFAKTYRNLMESQWYAKEQLVELQIKNLKSTINHAYQNVPYYTNLFNERGLKPKDIQDFRDLKKVPILTKDDVRKHLNSLKAQYLDQYKPILSHTSGSTGTAMDFYLTKYIESVIEPAHVWRHWKWAGFNHGDKVVTIRGAVLTEDPEAVAPYKQGENNLLLSSYHLSERSLNKYIKLLSTFEPKIIRAYPSSILIVTKFLKALNLPPIPSVKSIITSSETLLRSHREEIEFFWECKIYDWYGQGERCAAIGECTESGYHVNSEYSIVEFIDLDQNNKKRLIATTLHNYAMPLIRYDTRDLLTPTNLECLCGRGLPIVDTIDGRIEDIIATRDGRFIGRLDAAVKYSSGIKLCQIIQNQVGHIIVKIVKDENFCDDDFKKLNKELINRLGENIDIDYDFVDDIPRTKAGKFRFVISQISLEDLI